MADDKNNKGGTSERGFASMDPNRQREIASEGGKAAHEKGTAHEFTSQEAREAGRKGGEASHGGRSESNTSSSRSESNSGSSNKGGGSSSGQRGGSSEQHAEAGRQSHKNDDKR